LQEQNYNPKFVITAVEASADLLGAELIKTLKEQYPYANFYGVGGQRMINEGLQPWYHLDDFSVMGFTDVLKKYFVLKNKIRSLINKTLQINPDIYIGIDSPDLNFRIYHHLKESGISTVQYVSPQLWAWRKSRIHYVKKYIDMVLCLFPFEVDFYTSHNVKSLCIGHPGASKYKNKHQAKQSNNSSFRRITVFPGSRSQEIKLNLPFACDALNLIQKKIDIRVIFLAYSEKNLNQILELLGQMSLDFEYAYQINEDFNSLKDSALSIATSGTVTLELALLGEPAIVIYKVSKLNYFIYKLFGVTQLKFYALPNILLNKEIYREYIGHHDQVSALGEGLMNMLLNENIHKFNSAREALLEILDIDRSRIINDVIKDMME